MTQRLQITVEVPAERRSAFERMYLDFMTGESPHTREARALKTRARDVQERGVESLQALYEIAQAHSGQCRYVARFLAGLYNGVRFPFDLTDLRALDEAIFEHCLAVLRMDARPAKEVHEYFPDGGHKWEAMIARWGLDKEQVTRARELLREAGER